MFFTYYVLYSCVFFFFKQKTAYEMRISDWSSDVCSSDLDARFAAELQLASAALGDVEPRPAEDADRGVGVVTDQRIVLDDARRGRRRRIGEIGRASCRERVCQYV